MSHVPWRIKLIEALTRALPNDINLSDNPTVWRAICNAYRKNCFADYKTLLKDVRKSLKDGAIQTDDAPLPLVEEPPQLGKRKRESSSIKNNDRRGVQAQVNQMSDQEHDFDQVNNSDAGTGSKSLLL